MTVSLPLPFDTAGQHAGSAALDALDLLGIPAPLQHFEPSIAAVITRLDRLHPAIYARTRNALDGEVSGLSPYFSHGFLTLRQAVTRLARRHRIGYDDKLVFEFAWRAFFHHVWAHASDHGDAILRDMRPATVWAGNYARALPDDIREGRTGVPAIDAAVRTLYATGYLHNHARMWLASYVVHGRKVHWRTGADWLYAHLLDGDLPSNHLSWQWVAGTFSSKPYLFNAENVAKYAPASARAAWLSPKSSIDRRYEEAEAHARFRGDAGPEPGQHSAVAEPKLHSAPPEHLLTAIGANALLFNPASVAGQPVELVHPWALAERSNPAFRLGVVHLPAHAAWPWNVRRWRFVLTRMAAICDAIHIGPLASLDLSQASAVSAQATLFPGYREVLTSVAPTLHQPVGLFPDPAKACASFSSYYSRVQRDAPDFAALLAR